LIIEGGRLGTNAKRNSLIEEKKRKGDVEKIRLERKKEKEKSKQW